MQYPSSVRRLSSGKAAIDDRLNHIQYLTDNAILKLATENPFDKNLTLIVGVANIDRLGVPEVKLLLGEVRDLVDDFLLIRLY